MLRIKGRRGLSNAWRTADRASPERNASDDCFTSSPFKSVNDLSTLFAYGCPQGPRCGLRFVNASPRHWTFCTGGSVSQGGAP